MKRFGRLVIFAMLTLGLLAPGLAGTASAQDVSLCEAADGVAAGTKIQGYTVVEFTGGSGSQIVLGYGGAYLSGGSGNDVLCAWGTGNTLDGGSGNDLLVAMDSPGNAFYGGSGNDTMIGYVGDFFDGGSGRNVNVVPSPDLELSVDYGSDNSFQLEGTGFTPDATVAFSFAFFIGDVFNYEQLGNGSAVVEGDGSFEYHDSALCEAEDAASWDSVHITATGSAGVPYTEVFLWNCKF